MTSSPPESKYLTVADIRDTVHAYVERHMAAQEPVPAWQTVNLGRLEAALVAPQEAGFGVDYYPTAAEKAAVLLYRLVKNHAFENGNKRIATLATFLFLGTNDLWWDATNAEVYSHVTWVAASESRCYSPVLVYLSCYFGQKVIPIEVSIAARQAAEQAKGQASEQTAES